MNRIGLAAGCVLLGIGGQVVADCSAARVQDLSTLLNANTVCATGVNDSAGDKWQEYHETGADAFGGTLIEYAKGTNPLDPTHTVGTWSIADNGAATATVTHDYGPGNPYTWSVHSNLDSTYSFCNGSTEVATMPLPTSGQHGCGF